MKNTGLITFHDANNYGAALQTFAMKEILSRISNIEVLNIYNPIISHQMKIIDFHKGFPKILHDILRIKYRIKVINRFKEFSNSFLNKKELILDDVEFKKKVEYFQYLIVGSDQVWNPDLNGGKNLFYFLDFDKKNCIKASYASSYGGYEFSKEQKIELKRMLGDFNFISCREKDSALKLSSITGKRVEHVLDPTLLLEKDEWIKAMGLLKSKKKKYILVYRLNKNSFGNSELEQLKKITGIGEIFIVDQKLMRGFKNGVQLRDLGPKEFLDKIYNADYVITDSFHGCCFSLIFSKKLYAFLPPVRGNRIYSLFEILGIENLLNFAGEKMEYIDINYHEVHEKLSVERRNSLSYINSIYFSCN